MALIRFTVQVTRVGRRLAIVIPTAEAEAAGLREGDIVHVELTTTGPNPLGIFRV